MKGYRLNRVLFEMEDAATIRNWLSSEEAERLMTTAERSALGTEDVDQLLELGANPFLLVHTFRGHFIKDPAAPARPGRNAGST